MFKTHHKRHCGHLPVNIWKGVAPCVSSSVSLFLSVSLSVSLSLSLSVSLSVSFSPSLSLSLSVSLSLSPLYCSEPVCLSLLPVSLSFSEPVCLSVSSYCESPDGVINTGSHVADYRPAEPVILLGPVGLCENWECWCVLLVRAQFGKMVDPGWICCLCLNVHMSIQSWNCEKLREMRQTQNWRHVAHMCWNGNKLKYTKRKIHLFYSIF